MEGLPILAGSILRLPLWSYSKDQKEKIFFYTRGCFNFSSVLS
jgi:hypothetical protein